MPNQSILKKPFRYQYFNATLYLIAVNVGLFALGYAFPQSKLLMALNPRAVVSGYVWQIFTYMFAHADLSHLAVNMLGLFFFGTHVERNLGSREFILFYTLSGILAGVASLVIFAATSAWYTVLLGASGAVFAVLLAFAILDPKAMIYIYGIIPVRAPYLVLGYAGIELLSQMFSFRSSVAHLTHLAGFAVAWLYFLVRFGINPWNRLFRR
ncbi:MAG: rhomboid family protein [Spirochaetes bacterium]|nr:MAG: rhomboid family protein [Spirochaetota bacterium]